jgi:hypothetical protein
LFFKDVKTHTSRLTFFFVLGHGETAPSAGAGLAALQGRVLEGACDGDWVFDKGG